jgi:pimeloyl-ACP methyl ester carboxylesterase
VSPLVGLPAGLARLCRCAPSTLIAPLEPPPDRLILARPEVRAAIVDDLRQALRRGLPRRARRSAAALPALGFRLEEIAVPVELWHGVADAQVAVAVGRRVARRLRDCRARFLPDAAHLWLSDHCEEVLTTLRPRAG